MVAVVEKETSTEPGLDIKQEKEVEPGGLTTTVIAIIVVAALVVLATVAVIAAVLVYRRLVINSIFTFRTSFMHTISQMSKAAFNHVNEQICEKFRHQ